MALFRKSPVKNDSLQKYIKLSNSGKPLHLIADVKTRWNSPQAMLERFLRVCKDINKALIDLSTVELILTEIEISTILSIVDVLDIILIGSKEISKNDMNLFKADRVMEWMISKVGENTSSFAKRMKESLEKSFGSDHRRNACLAGLIKYLSSENSSPCTFTYPKNGELVKKARDLYIRLFASENHNQTVSETQNITSEEKQGTQSDIEANHSEAVANNPKKKEG